jgi:hypothetical protein
MRNRVSKLLLPFVAIGLFAGCGGNPPTAELEAANRALQDAKSAGADRFAANELSSAQSAYDKAKSAMEAEQQKLFKNFDQVTPMISDAKAKAEGAKSTAVATKAQAKRGADSNIASADAALQSARSSVANAPSGKGTEGDIEQLQTELGSAEADLSAARAAASREDFDTAKSKASSAKMTAEAVSAGVEAAAQKHAEMVEKTKPWYERI